MMICSILWENTINNLLLILYISRNITMGKLILIDNAHDNSQKCSAIVILKKTRMLLLSEGTQRLNVKSVSIVEKSAHSNALSLVRPLYTILAI